MNKDYKAKLLEKAGIYIDCCQLLKCVYKLLFFNAEEGQGYYW